MRPGRLIAIFVALWVSSTLAFAARAETPYEAAVQYALEHLTSGIATAFCQRRTKNTSLAGVRMHHCGGVESVRLG